MKFEPLTFVHTNSQDGFISQRNLGSKSEIGVQKRKSVQSCDLVMEEVARYGRNGKICSIFRHPQPHLHQPRKKTSKKLYFSIQEKSSKMDLFGLAASHLGGLALCALQGRVPIIKMENGNTHFGRFGGSENGTWGDFPFQIYS